MTIVVVTWVTAADVAVAIGVPPATADDDAWLTQVTAAANEWAFLRRSQNGYVDDPVAVPSTAVATGVIRVAEDLYRSRGGGDSYASFDALDVAPIVGPGMAHVNRLLGVPRAGIG